MTVLRAWRRFPSRRRWVGLAAAGILLAVVGAALYAFVFTYVMLKLIHLITHVRVEAQEESAGLDISLHGEKAYDEGAL